MATPAKINNKVGHIIDVFSSVMCPIFFIFKEDFLMKKIKMSRGVEDRGMRSKVFISTKGGHPSITGWECRVNDSDIRADTPT